MIRTFREDNLLWGLNVERACGGVRRRGE
jgi:hypothetical protein